MGLILPSYNNLAIISSEIKLGVRLTGSERAVEFFTALMC
jgi:hypothetical protein